MLTALSYGATPPTSSPANSIVPASGSSKPAIIRSVVVFPDPDGPEHREELTTLDFQVDSGNGYHLAVVLGEAGQADVRG